MARYSFAVFTNPTLGREEEYNRWYDQVHLGEVLEVPGFVAAQRLRLRPLSGDAGEHRYLAIYELETDDPEAALAELTARAGDGRLRMSGALGSVRTELFEVITPRRERAR